jgi:hypothetical protein
MELRQVAGFATAFQANLSSTVRCLISSARLALHDVVQLIVQPRLDPLQTWFLSG